MREKGFTIMELMVGMAVGLLVLLAVTAVYITALRTSASTLDSSRLNQEMAAIMNIMANDIRRAGYWGGGAINFQNAADNPFTAVETAASAGDISALRVHSNGGSGTTYDDVTYDDDGFVSAASIGSCITYTYDVNSNDLLEDDEEFGFRWDGWPAGGWADYDNTTKQGLLLMRTSNNATGANGCLSSDGNWLAVNDVDEVVITGLSFDLLGSACYNASEPDGTNNDAVAGDADKTTNPEEFDCYAVAPTVMVAGPPVVEGNSTVESLQVLITLSAQLANDADVTFTLRQTVQIRNNLIRVR
jgi:type IV pilus assembly protein PilW